MDKHNVRLVLRPHIGIEARLIAYLRQRQPRRNHVNICVADLLAKGLAHSPPGADVEANVDPSAEVMNLYVPLARANDALVLDALAGIAERYRNDWLRARLLAGFAASENVLRMSNTSQQTSVPAPFPETLTPAIASNTKAAPLAAPSPAIVSPTEKDPRSLLPSVPPPAAVDIEIDVPTDFEIEVMTAEQVAAKAVAENMALPPEEQKLRPELRGLFS